MVDGPMDLEGDCDTILEIVIGSYTRPQNRLVELFLIWCRTI